MSADETHTVRARLQGMAGQDARFTFDHIAIATRDLTAAAASYENLGLEIEAPQDFPHEQVRIAVVACGDLRIELMEPLSPQSFLHRFLDRRGEGLHHIAFRVGDTEAELEAVRATLQQRSVRLVSDKIQTGLGGHRYFFVHPQSMHGVLVELVSGGVN